MPKGAGVESHEGKFSLLGTSGFGNIWVELWSRKLDMQN